MRKTYTFFTTHKAYFSFLTLQINLSFLFLKVVYSSSSKNTNNPTPVYIKYNVNNK